MFYLFNLSDGLRMDSRKQKNNWWECGSFDLGRFRSNTTVQRAVVYYKRGVLGGMINVYVNEGGDDFLLFSKCDFGRKYCIRKNALTLFRTLF